MATPGTLAVERVKKALSGSGSALASLVEVGSHAERFRVN
jgi:hypothetical protein